eukprot:TRINITY_DN46560_c0_g1_i1.p1 TRINITY_DN46560_c0_g1~~TRINITY_DN46560_c0_g1_i1.p1  ORF type:complete len:379 (-),score=60.83 TRINITY_DN46560_c0_g1_i1:326-1420(-)
MVVHHVYDALHHDLDWSGHGHALDGHSSKWKTTTATVVKQLRGVHALRDAQKAGNKKRLALQALIVVCCGCLSLIPCELILKHDKQGMMLVNVATYLFAITSSVIGSGGAVLTSRKIPLRLHACIVASGYICSQLCRLAFQMGLSMPIALVVKNGGLLCQMLVQLLMLGEHFSAVQILSAVAVTFGIIVTVTSNMNSKPPNVGEDVESVSVLVLALPALVQLGAMMSRAIGASVSQRCFKEHGRLYDEVMFYQHALGFPLLLMEWRTLMVQVQSFSATPTLFVYLVATMALNYIVTSACSKLIGMSNSVVLNIVLTIQRFVSIVISAMIFNAPPYPPVLMWFGACLVVLGCLSYVLAPAPEKTA